MKKDWFIFLVVTFLAGILAGYLFGFGRGFEQGMNQPRETLDSLIGQGSTPSLQYYWNGTYKFSFEYPASWSIRESYYPDQAFMSEPWSSFEFFITIEDQSAQDHSGFIGISKKTPEEIKILAGNYAVKTFSAHGYTYSLWGNANGAQGTSPGAAEAIRTVFESFSLMDQETESAPIE